MKALLEVIRVHVPSPVQDIAVCTATDCQWDNESLTHWADHLLEAARVLEQEMQGKPYRTAAEVDDDFRNEGTLCVHIPCRVRRPEVAHRMWRDYGACSRDHAKTYYGEDVVE